MTTPTGDFVMNSQVAATGSDAVKQLPVFLGSDMILLPQQDNQGNNVVSDQYLGPANEGNLNQSGRLGPGAHGAYTVADIEDQWWNMTAGQQQNIAQRLYNMGYLDTPRDLATAQTVLNTGIEQAATYAAHGQFLSPFDVLERNKVQNADKLAARAAVGPDGLLHSSRVNIADKTTAESIAKQALNNALGRDPTQAELSTFYDTLVAKEKANPSDIASKVDGSGQEIPGSQEISKAGFGSDSTAIDSLVATQMDNNPEARARQSVLTYLGALQQALGSPLGDGKT